MDHNFWSLMVISPLNVNDQNQSSHRHFVLYIPFSPVAQNAIIDLNHPGIFFILSDVFRIKINLINKWDNLSQALWKNPKGQSHLWLTEYNWKRSSLYPFDFKNIINAIIFNKRGLAEKLDRVRKFCQYLFNISHSGSSRRFQFVLYI